MALILKYSFVFILVFSFLTPFIFIGATTVNPQIQNPLGTNGPQNLPDFIVKVIEIIMYVGVPLLVIAVIYAGFLYVKAQGNSEALKKAHQTLLYTVIGGFLLLGAFVISKAIGDTVKEIQQSAS